MSRFWTLRHTHTSLSVISWQSSSVAQHSAPNPQPKISLFHLSICMWSLPVWLDLSSSLSDSMKSKSDFKSYPTPHSWKQRPTHPCVLPCKAQPQVICTHLITSTHSDHTEEAVFKSLCTTLSFHGVGLQIQVKWLIEYKSICGHLLLWHSVVTFKICRKGTKVQSSINEKRSWTICVSPPT